MFAGRVVTAIVQGAAPDVVIGLASLIAASTLASSLHSKLAIFTV